MTSDTIKSLGYLKNSLRMNRKAIAKNLTADAIDKTELLAFAAHSKAMFDQIEAWEKANAPVATPAGIVQPAPAAATVSTVPIVPDPADSDLLTSL